MVAPRVFLDFAVDGASLGRVIFELYNVSAPKTAENFRALCTGERGVSAKSQVPLYYKHSKMHRVIPDFMIQGGDFTKGNGTGGESIYGAPFADEDLSRPVDEPGLLVMANKGPNTNNSQFFITLRPCPHLTGKHVVFGRVIRGFDDVIQRIAAVSTDERDRPTVPVEIVNCGELQLVRRPSEPVKKQSAEVDSAGASDESGAEGKEERGRKRMKHPRYSSSSRSRSRSRIRSRSRSVSRTPSDSDSVDERKKKNSHKEKKEKKSKKHKKRRHRSGSRSRSRSVDANGVTPAPKQETEEEYDARLEREERERIEAARLRELAVIKKRYEAERAKTQAATGGVRFKGRGRMKYVDPELHARRDD